MEAVSALLAGWPAAGLAGGLGVTVCAAAGLLLYKIARRKKPTHTTVNCWFCNQDAVVPYGNRNCWDCPNCEQYNGFQENGDYNKPIPAQYMEHLNHVVSGATTFCDPTKPQQWVSSQILLCKKCNNHQTMKIKQLASFAPREEGKYDEEIEVYKHHLEQTYKLCRPCQAAVEYYIKHQNRQLRALLLSHHFKRWETDKPYMQSFCSSSSSSMTTPTQVIILRFMTFLSCVFLVLMAWCGAGDPFSLKVPAPAPVESVPTAVGNGTGASPAAASENRTLLGVTGWWELLHLLPEQMVMNLSIAWTYGRSHQIAVVVLGLFTCLLAMLLAGRIRLRRIDAFASVLWLLVTGLYLAEEYLKADTPSWLDTAKFSTTSLCCLVGFTAAVATRKSTGQRRYRPRRYLSGESVALFPNGSGIGFPCSTASPSVFIPTPPSILQLMNQQFFRSPRRASSSSLPGRLNRALSLGTIPSLARADSGYLFSGSRPASQASHSKESPASEYYSLLSGSCASSPIPSPAPSVAGSVTSSSGSLRYRRPLISPARLNLKGQRLLLFPSQSDALHTPTSLDEPTHSDSNIFVPELSLFPKKNLNERAMHDMRSVVERGSICSNNSMKKEDNSSHSSTCVVDTTTKGEDPAGWRGRFGNSIVRGLLAMSLTANAIFTSAYLYQSLR
ncbi:transmembrane protein 201 [Carettochelys insculpta]|uniref:transmembrane protein 201 n=1 Tax=Carettochelys insculpta TaxID=44489 RepID=UPI003EC084A1